MRDPVISVDGMGGDAAPEIVIEGLDLVARSQPGARFLVHGPKDRISTLLASKPAAAAVTEVRHAELVLGMDMKPSQAMRQGKGSTMWNAIASVEAGEADAVVSAGNTGALMALSMLRLRLAPGVQRPALVASWPTLTGYAAVLDVGANLEASAEQLVEFAIMGEAFHRAVHGKARPRVAVLNVGSEDQKGHEEVRAAAKLMREGAVSADFHGFVEGGDISLGAVDVVVTDGFTGNVALKTAEGTAKLVGAFLKDALTSSPLAMLGAAIASPALKRLKARMDPRTVNGAVLLGVGGLVVKSHGGTDGPGYAAALTVALRMINGAYRSEVEANLARLAEQRRRAPAEGLAANLAQEAS